MSDDREARIRAEQSFDCNQRMPRTWTRQKLDSLAQTWGFDTQQAQFLTDCLVSLSVLVAEERDDLLERIAEAAGGADSKAESELNDIRGMIHHETGIAGCNTADAVRQLLRRMAEVGRERGAARKDRDDLARTNESLREKILDLEEQRDARMGAIATELGKAGVIVHKGESLVQVVREVADSREELWNEAHNLRGRLDRYVDWHNSVIKALDVLDTVRRNLESLGGD